MGSSYYLSSKIFNETLEDPDRCEVRQRRLFTCGCKEGELPFSYLIIPKICDDILFRIEGDTIAYGKIIIGSFSDNLKALKLLEKLNEVI